MKKILLAAALLAVAAPATANGVREGSQRLDARRLTESRAEARGLTRDASLLDSRRLSDLSVQLPEAITAPAEAPGGSATGVVGAFGDKVRARLVESEGVARGTAPAGLRAKLVVDDPRAELGMTWEEYANRPRPALRLRLVQDSLADGETWTIVRDLMLPQADPASGQEWARNLNRIDGLTFVPATGEFLYRE